MSDSELSSPTNDLADDKIERSLRRVVRALSKTGEDVTVNKVRRDAETELGLRKDFFKNTPAWKQKSKDIITDAVEQGEEASSAEITDPQSKAKPARTVGRKRKSEDEAPIKNRPAKKTRKAISDDDGSKRDLCDKAVEVERIKTPANQQKRKGQREAPKKVKKAFSDSDVGEKSEQSQLKSPEPVKRSTKIKRDIQTSDLEGKDHPMEAEGVELEDREHDEIEREQTQSKMGTSIHATESDLSDVPHKIEIGKAMPNADIPCPEDDESDMSSLIDEPRPKKQRQKKKAASESRAKSKSAAPITNVAKSKSGKGISADDEEIKRLQSWLVKCGIRKMWWKELAPYQTGKDKIRHLKEMLDDAGMTGRYSNEKARQIKESRELAAELEAVEEFNERWGQSDEEGGTKGEDDDSGEAEEELAAAPKRRLPKGFIDFGDSGDDGSD